MNDMPRKIREGFVEDKPEPPKPEDVKAALAKHPGPELQDSPAELDALQEMVWPIVVKLTWKTIENQNGETIDQLSFREPRGGDINRYGNPVRMNSMGDWVIEERKMHAIMGALSDVYVTSLDRLDPRDWNSCAYELMRFFLPTRRVS
jgi:hypothetical protein